MKMSSFFKILNRKIEMYNKMASNPFMESQPIIVIWIEKAKNEYQQLEDEEKFNY